MYVISVAARHLRTRSISWVAVALIAIIVTLYLLIISVLEGSKAHWMDKLQSIMAHATVGVADLAGGIEYPEKWAAELSQIDPGIKGVTISLESPTMALFDRARTVGTLRGIDLDRELEIGRLKEILFPRALAEFGRHEKKGRMRPGCIVGGAWKKSYDLALGDSVTFMFSSDDDNPRGIQFTIVGFFTSDNPYLENGAYVDRKFLAEEIMVPGRAKTLSIWLKDPNRRDLDQFKQAVRAKVQAMLRRDAPQYASDAERVNVESWQDKDNKFYHAVSSENMLMRIIMGIFLALLAFIMFLIFGRLVAEKVRDIGALRAIGATPAGIRACFLTQAFFIGAAGLLVGLAAAFLLIHNLNGIVGFIAETLRMQIFPGDLFGPGRMLLTRTLPLDVLTISILTILSALAGAFFPALRASRMNPVECLRHE
jgi:ABC-type lipoprotein release transport system permease subunit